MTTIEIPKLFEVRIYEPAETGLFAHPSRIRLTNCFQFNPTVGKTQCLKYGMGYWDFQDGVCEKLFSGSQYCRAEIVGEIDESRSMEEDWFEDWDGESYASGEY